MENKEFEKLYQNTFNKIDIPDELFNKVKNLNEEKKKLKFDFRVVSLLAACLVVAIVTLILINPFTDSKNSFVLKAGAEEIGSDSPVAIAYVHPSLTSRGSGVESLTIPFSVFCDGDNIASVKYTVQNAVFVFPYEEYEVVMGQYYDILTGEPVEDKRTLYPKAAELSDKDYDKVPAEIKVDNGILDAPQYSSYTLDYEEQKLLEQYDDMQSFPIQLSADISTEGYTFKWVEYFDLASDLSEIHEDEELFNEMLSVYLEETQKLYNDIFDKTRIIIEVTYEDGTTESETFKISCIRANEEEGHVMGAQIVEE